jgi:hypothetical protein
VDHLAANKRESTNAALAALYQGIGPDPIVRLIAIALRRKETMTSRR